MPPTDDVLLTLARRFGWRPTTEPVDGVMAVDPDLRWMLAGLSEVGERRVSWRVEQASEKPAHAGPSGYVGAQLATTVKGLRYVAEEYFESEPSYPAYQILRAETNQQNYISLGYFENWPDNWIRR